MVVDKSCYIIKIFPVITETCGGEWYHSHGEWLAPNK